MKYWKLVEVRPCMICNGIGKKRIARETIKNIYKN